MGVKIEANKSNGGIKISALGDELRVDPRHIVAAAKEMAMENAKVPASWVTAGQADRLRAKFGGHTELKAKIERKLRYMESALDTPSPAPKVDSSIKTQSVKLGKRTFEADRRSIFGVVARPGASEIPAQKAAAPADVTAPVETKKEAAPVAEPSTLAVPLPAPKKFIQVTVAPPIRREPGSPDPRFGVIVPSPEVEKKEASTAIWGNLNDGHAPVDFSKPAAPVDLPEAVEEIKAAAPAVVIEETKKASPTPPTPKAHVESVRAEKPAAPATVVPPVNAAHHAQSNEATTRKRTMDVPVKWEPKNKAFGSKVKHKTKVLKKLEALGVIGKEAEKKKQAAPKKHESKPAAKHTSEPVKHESKKSSEHKTDHGAEKKEGVLKRLMRKIFK